MRKNVRTIGTALATAIFSATLLAGPAFAAAPAPVPSATLTQRGDTDTHARFCVKMEHVLRRLVEKGAITAEQSARVLEAIGCAPAQ